MSEPEPQAIDPMHREVEPLYYFGQDAHPNRHWEPAEIVGVKNFAGTGGTGLNAHYQLRYPDGVAYLIHAAMAREGGGQILTREALRGRLKDANARIRHHNRIIKALKTLLGHDVEPE